MSKMRKFMAFGLLLAATAAWAQKTDGLIVTAGDAEQQFAISEVKELTFSDEGLTVVKTDNVTLGFAAGWQIRFGEVESSGISLVRTSDADAKAQVFDAEGRLVKELRLADLHIGELPKGVYIIMCNGKTFKTFK